MHKITSDFFDFIRPVYALAGGLVAILIVFSLFLWSYPNQPYARTPQYFVYIFLNMGHTIITTIFFIPCWVQMINLFKEQAAGKDAKQRVGLVFLLLLTVFFFVALFELVNAGINSFRDTAQFTYPAGSVWRTNALTIYAALAIFFPICLIIILLHIATQTCNRQVTLAGHDEEKLLGVARQLLRYRNILQSSLLIVGVILSIAAVSGAAFRSALIAGQVTDAAKYPLAISVVYGLGYTMILVVFYAPVHLYLSETSRKLRDQLCPIDSLRVLEDALKKRAALDTWLETNVGLIDNLKTGIIVIAPLITSLLTNLFGAN